MGVAAKETISLWKSLKKKDIFRSRSAAMASHVSEQTNCLSFFLSFFLSVFLSVIAFHGYRQEMCRRRRNNGPLQAKCSIIKLNHQKTK